MQNPITQERLKELFNYNPDTGLFTRLTASSPGYYPGEIAGYLTKEGYVRMGIDGQLERAHRLAWLYMTGEWPTKCLDHINRIKNDNSFCNLRDVSSKENSQNRNPRKLETKPKSNSKNQYVGISKKATGGEQE